MTEPRDVDRWQRIEALVDGALDVPDAARDQWLRERCGDDTLLYREVRDLIEAGQRPDTFLDSPVAGLAAELDRGAGDPATGPLSIGAWRVVGEIGRGGMGSVYLAEREAHFRQRAAIKLVRAGHHLDEEIIRRFVEERQLLAGLEHANIARLLDGGVTDEGLPWFAMEFIEGLPVDRWCDENRLSVEARLEIFRTICDAVDYAHGRQIVHRDLKPSNILVRADGVVKLLDFGVAKLLEDDTAAPDRTRTGVRLLTPDYASPEQLRGSGVSPASDVYSLGVLLYELLTGRRPYRVTGRSIVELERAVLTQEPVRPSTIVSRPTGSTAGESATGQVTAPTAAEVARARGTTTDRLRERLRGDIDRIVLKALAKEPSQRYESARELSLDVQRYLDGVRVRAGAVRSRRRTIHRAIIGAAVLTAAFVVTRLPWQFGSARDDQSAVAVGLFTDYRGDTTSAMVRPLADLLATNLARLPSLHVVSTARLYELMAQLGSAESPDAGAFGSAARRAGASILVDGALYGLEDGRLRLDLRRIDVASGNVLSAHSVTGSSLFALVDSASTQLAGAMGILTPIGSVAEVTTTSEVAARFYNQGLQAYFLGRRTAARPFFEAALAEDSTFAMAAFYLAQTTIGLAAVDTFRRALRLARRTTDRERLIIETNFALMLSEPRALAAAETLSVRYPFEFDGQLLAAQAMIAGGDWRAALPRLRRVMTADSIAFDGTGICPRCPARADLIDVLVALDSIDAAEREARIWMNLVPSAAIPVWKLSQIQLMRGDFAAARDSYRQAIALEPSYEGTPEHIYALNFDADPADVDRRLHDLIDNASAGRSSDAMLYLAGSLQRQGRYDEAVQYAHRYRIDAAARYPATPPLRFALSEAEARQTAGQCRAAAALFDSATAAVSTLSKSMSSGGTATDIVGIVECLTVLGDTARVPALVDSLRVLASNTLLGSYRVLPDYGLGLLFASRGDDEAAIRQFRRAILSPVVGAPRIKIELARALLRRERPVEAVAVLQPLLRAPWRTLQVRTTPTEIEALLGRAWEEAGHRDSATVHYNEVLRIWSNPDPPVRLRADSIRARLDRLAS